MHKLVKTNKWLLACCIGIVLGSGFLRPILIQAQSSFSLTISPPSAYIKIKPGTKAEHVVTLTNNTPNPMTVVPRIFDSQPASGTGYPELQSTFDFPYLSDPAQGKPITINPEETKKYTINFSVPPEASSKEYPLTILFSTTIEQEKPNETSFSQSKLYGVVGANIVVLVSNETTLPNLLKVMEIKRPVILDSLRELSFTPILLNHGIQATVASGSATIVDTFGRTVYSETIYPDVFLGNQQRSVRAINSNSLTQLPQPTNFNFDPLFLLGKYSITINLTDIQGNTINTYTKTCVALPYSIAIALLCIGAGWILSRMWLVKKQNQG